MAANKGHYVISAPGFISNEAPYTNYLPEFYQQASYTSVSYTHLEEKTCVKAHKNRGHCRYFPCKQQKGTGKR